MRYFTAVILAILFPVVTVLGGLPPLKVTNGTDSNNATFNITFPDDVPVSSSGTTATVAFPSYSKNYIGNGHYNVSVTGTSAFADAAGTSPVDGTGGSPTVTCTRTTSSPLDGAGSGLITKDASNRQGEGCSAPFTTQAVHGSLGPAMLTIAYDYIVASGNFVAGTSSTASDITMWVYDVTNSLLIQPVDYKLYCSSTTVSCKYIGQFQTTLGSNSYRLIFHVGSTSASAYALKYDNVSVSVKDIARGPPVTDWTSFTVVSGLTGGTNSFTGKWRRVGDSMDVNIIATYATIFTAGSATFPLPSGYTIDTAKFTTTPTQGRTQLGRATLQDITNTNTDATVLYDTNSQVQVRFNDDSANGVIYDNISTTAPFTWANGDIISLHFKVPISGWSSSVAMSSDAGTRKIEAHYTANAGQTIETAGSGEIINFEDLGANGDSHSAVTTGASWKFTMPESGCYWVNVAVTFQNVQWVLDDFAEIAARKNGTIVSTIDYWEGQATITQNLMLNGTVRICGVATDYIDIFSDIGRTGGNTDLITNGLYTFISIVKEGPGQQIAAAEVVKARYSTNAGQTLEATGSGEVINFEDVDYDSHGSVTIGASWKFTSNRSQNCTVSVNLGLTTAVWTATNYGLFYIRKNGTAIYEQDWQAIATATESLRSQMTTDIQMVSGDYIDVFFDHARTGGDVTLVSTGTLNTISIKCTGL